MDEGQSVCFMVSEGGGFGCKSCCCVAVVQRKKYQCRKKGLLDVRRWFIKYKYRVYIILVCSYVSRLLFVLYRSLLAGHISARYSISARKFENDIDRVGLVYGMGNPKNIQKERYLYGINSKSPIHQERPHRFHA